LRPRLRSLQKSGSSFHPPASEIGINLKLATPTTALKKTIAAHQ
jgi:hypothetical protein